MFTRAGAPRDACSSPTAAARGTRTQDLAGWPCCEPSPWATVGRGSHGGGYPWVGRGCTEHGLCVQTETPGPLGPLLEEAAPARSTHLPTGTWCPPGRVLTGHGQSPPNPPPRCCQGHGGGPIMGGTRAARFSRWSCGASPALPHPAAHPPGAPQGPTPRPSQSPGTRHPGLLRLAGNGGACGSVIVSPAAFAPDHVASL